MSGLSKTCFGFSLPLPKAENCLAEHHRKTSILTMLHPSQLGQNGGAKIFGHRYIIYIWLRSGMWKPYKWLSLKIQNSEKIGGEQMIFAEKAWNLLRFYQNIINWKKLTFALQKYSLLSADSSKFSNSYSNFVNLAKIPTKWSAELRDDRRNTRFRKLWHFSGKIGVFALWAPPKVCHVADLTPVRSTSPLTDHFHHGLRRNPRKYHRRIKEFFVLIAILEAPHLFWKRTLSCPEPTILGHPLEKVQVKD